MAGGQAGYQVRGKTRVAVAGRKRRPVEGSDRAGRHFAGNVLGLSDRQRHNGQRRIFRRSCGELAAVRYEQVPDIVCLAHLLTTPSCGFSIMRLVPSLWVEG
jgi:hypothetical protein